MCKRSRRWTGEPGQGGAPITREVITWTQAGVHLSIGDLGMLITMIVVAASTWYLVDHGAPKANG
jgi:hypothetical protein